MPQVDSTRNGSMQLTGIFLGGGVATLWGVADFLATFSARRLTTLKTLCVSQLVRGLVFVLVMSLVLISRGSSFPLLTHSLVPGVLIGVCTTGGYWALYRALELGPAAIVSPLTSLSVLITLALSVSFLGEHVTLPDGIATGAVLLGCFFVSVDSRERLPAGKKKLRLLSLPMGQGVGWAAVSALLFGCMDFGIGAATPSYGWFAPACWTCLFSGCMALGGTFWKRHHQQKEKQPLLKRRTWHVSLSAASALCVGLLEATALFLFGMATQFLQPGLTAAIASNYPVITVLLSVFVSRERLTKEQVLGIGLVLCGLFVITFSCL